MEDGTKKPGKGAVVWAYAAAVALWIWDATVWVSLKTLDLSLFLILSFTEGARSVRPTIRASFSSKERSAIARSQGRRCNYCGARLTRDNLNIDHMVPVSRGGLNDGDNLQALCRRCNIRKGNHTDEEFRERYEAILDWEAPPRQTIPQRRFDQITRSTDAHEGVREANRNRYQTRRQRVVNSLPFAVMFWWILQAVASYVWVPGLFSPAMFFGWVFGVAFAAGLFLRARHTGAFEEPSEQTGKGNHVGP